MKQLTDTQARALRMKYRGTDTIFVNYDDLCLLPSDQASAMIEMHDLAAIRLMTAEHLAENKWKFRATKKGLEALEVFQLCRASHRWLEALDRGDG
jgi:hypothetical protein